MPKGEIDNKMGNDNIYRNLNQNISNTGLHKFILFFATLAR